MSESKEKIDEELDKANKLMEGAAAGRKYSINNSEPLPTYVNPTNYVDISLAQISKNVLIDELMLYAVKAKEAKFENILDDDPNIKVLHGLAGYYDRCVLLGKVRVKFIDLLKANHISLLSYFYHFDTKNEEAIGYAMIITKTVNDYGSYLRNRYPSEQSEFNRKINGAWNEILSKLITGDDIIHKYGSLGNEFDDVVNYVNIYRPNLFYKPPFKDKNGNSRTELIKETDIVKIIDEYNSKIDPLLFQF